MQLPFRPRLGHQGRDNQISPDTSISITLTMSSNPLPDGSRDKAESIDIEAVKAYLHTPYEDVFEVSQDGLTYQKPASLRGVPVNKIQESDDYWNTIWISLNNYLAQEETEERLKSESKQRLDLDPHNKALYKEAKYHQDNVSKHRKIREVFGSRLSCHPNQVIAKRYLPLHGLCEQELMYLLGCKVTDLQFLANRGLMRMEPWDFIRWRIGELLLKRNRSRLPGQKSEIKAVIHHIAGERSEDSLFRQAILYSARLQGRGNSFGSKKRTGTYHINGQAQTSVETAWRGHRRVSPLKTRPIPRAPRYTSPRERQAAQDELDRFKQERRRQRAERVKEASVFAGVNAYRKQKLGQNSLGGPCGG